MYAIRLKCFLELYLEWELQQLQDQSGLVPGPE